MFAALTHSNNSLVIHRWGHTPSRLNQLAQILRTVQAPAGSWVRTQTSTAQQQKSTQASQFKASELQPSFHTEAHYHLHP